MRLVTTAKGISAAGLAIGSALASIACCLPWGFAAALGAAGASIFPTTLRPWLLAISILLLGAGFWQQRHAAQCGIKRSAIAGALLWSAAAIVVSMAFFPQVIAGLIADFYAAKQ